MMALEPASLLGTEPAADRLEPPSGDDPNPRHPLEAIPQALGATMLHRKAADAIGFRLQDRPGFEPHDVKLDLVVTD